MHFTLTTRLVATWKGNRPRPTNRLLIKASASKEIAEIKSNDVNEPELVTTA
jgi:hypothetical protein